MSKQLLSSLRSWWSSVYIRDLRRRRIERLAAEWAHAYALWKGTLAELDAYREALAYAQAKVRSEHGRRWPEPLPASSINVGVRVGAEIYEAED